MSELLIKNAALDLQSDILIKDGLFSKIGPDLETTGETIDGTGLYAVSSFLDLHAHFRDPGYTEKESLESGMKAAAAGGYTFVNLMANTKPVISSMEQVIENRETARKIGLCDIHQSVSLTKDFDGKTLTHLVTLDNGVLFLSDDGKGVMSNKTMYDAMKIALEKEYVICSHAEDMDLSPIDYRLAENIITARDLMLCEATLAHLHLCHVSTKEAMEMIIAAKNRGVNVTCEVTPHHIALYDNPYRVNPPIREEADVDFLIAALKSGFVDCISTDHAPHTKQDKENGAPGLCGLETAFSVCYTTLCATGHMTLPELLSVMSRNPARIARLMKGAIREGYDGDLTLIDLRKEFTVDPKHFYSKGKNTPFAGKRLRGEIQMTINRGKITYKR